MYIGKETLLTYFNAFDLSGYIPPYIFSRIKEAEIVGLWQRWRELSWDRLRYSGKQFSLTSSSLVQKPNMSGYMFVLFAVLFLGEALALICFCTECIKLLWLKRKSDGNAVKIIHFGRKLESQWYDVRSFL